MDAKITECGRGTSQRRGRAARRAGRRPRRGRDGREGGGRADRERARAPRSREIQTKVPACGSAPERFQTRSGEDRILIYLVVRIVTIVRFPLALAARRVKCP